MNRKQLILLIVVAVVVSGLGLYSYNTRNHSWEDSSEKLGQKLLKNFPMNDVDRVSIKQSQGQLNLARKNDIWTVISANKKVVVGDPLCFNNTIIIVRFHHRATGENLHFDEL